MSLEQALRAFVQEVARAIRNEPDVEETQYSLPIQTTSTIERQGEGQHRLFSISAVSALNRVGEIDSRDLFDSFVMMWRQTGVNPRRDFMHLGHFSDEFVVGEIDYMARVGNTLVTSTLYYDTELAQAEILARQKSPEKWGDSISYIPLEEEAEEVGDDTIQVIRAGHLKFVSTLPERMAASLHTSGEVQEVARMAQINERDFEALVELLDGDRERAQEWLSRVDSIETSLEADGAMTRSTDTEQETEQEVEEEIIDDVGDTEPEAVDTVLELTDETADALIARMMDAPGFIERMQQIESRLDVLEADETERMQTFVGDLPRRQTLTYDYRPRHANAPENGVGDLTPEQQAEQAIEGWNTAEYREAAAG